MLDNLRLPRWDSAMEKVSGDTYWIVVHVLTTLQQAQLVGNSPSHLELGTMEPSKRGIPAAILLLPHGYVELWTSCVCNVDVCWLCCGLAV